MCLFAFISDSSPKTKVSKNVHLLSNETIQDTVNMLSTPTRRNRFMLGNHHANMMNDDSPVLSQESINISWKWNNEGTPIRPTNKATKLRRSITNNSPHMQSLQRLKRNSSENQNGTTASGNISSMVIAEPETHSPKGLYKFQEEMRKIQFDMESDTSCDNLNNDKSMTEVTAVAAMTPDTGYPTDMEGGAAQGNLNKNQHTNATSSSSSNVHMMEDARQDVKTTNNYGLDDNIADDLFNDSDFDQILLTCKMPSEQEQASETVVTSEIQSIVKKASSAPEIKASGSSNSSGSNWNIAADDDDDYFDDLVKDFDVDIPSTLNTSAKFTRHKSMPQQPQKPNNTSSTTTKSYVPQQSSYVNRKSFIRHESMPITNTSMTRPSASNNNNHISAKQNSGMFSIFLFI